MLGTNVEGVDRFNKMARRSCNSHEPNHSLGDRLMAYRNDITAEYLRSILNYNPETGIFTWIVDRGRCYKAGSVAGNTDFYGYIRITIDGKKYKAHRLAELYMNGAWPPHHIDHINRNKSDNRFLNLRHASQSENAANSKVRVNNIAGLKGVSFIEKRNKYRSRIVKNGKEKHLGLFNSPQEAHAAYIKAAGTHYGEYARGA